MKVVINKCYGGFGLSALATRMLAELKGEKAFFYKYIDIGHRELGFVRIDNLNKAEENFIYHTIKKDLGEMIGDLVDDDYLDLHYERHDKNLINVVETLKEKANGRFAELRVVEIPDEIEYEIEEYDGFEHIAEKHRTWG